VEGILVAGDFNQDIDHQRIQQFMTENGLYEVYQEVNDFEDCSRDKTYKKGSNQIDVVFTNESLLRYVRGSRLVDFNKVVISDHIGFLLDIDYEKYFGIRASVYLSNRKHKAQFYTKLDKYIEQIELLEKTARICTNRVTVVDLNRLDDAIMYVLSAARRYVEGSKRNVPYSRQKQIKESTVKYLKVLLNKK